MAGEQQQGRVVAVNGGGPEPPAPEVVAVKRAERRAAEAASVLADMAKLGDDGEPAQAQPAAPPAPVAQEAEPEPEPEPADAADAPEPEAPTDPEQARRLKLIQRDQKRAKAAIQAERDAWRKERETAEAAWRERLKAAEDFERTRTRARQDLAGHLRALGYSNDDFEAAARAIYAESTAAAQDPRAREAAGRLMREREYMARIDELETGMRRMQQQAEEREAAVRQRGQVDAYLDGVVKGANGETPLASAMLERQPAKAREMLARIAAEIAAEFDEVPEPGEVLREFEKQRRADLEAMGITLDQAVPAPRAPRPGRKVAPPAPAVTGGGRQVEPATAPRSRLELEADVIRALRDGKFES